MAMLDVPEVTRIANDLARQALPPGSVVNITSEPIVDWIGDEGFQVMVVIRADALEEAISSGAAVGLRYRLQRSLQARGEHRFASVRWATDADLLHFEAENKHADDGNP